MYLCLPFQRPIGPAIGLFCQFIIMPCNAYFLGWLFLETSYERLGLLLLGSSPGGANSNFWVSTSSVVTGWVQYCGSKMSAQKKVHLRRPTSN